MRNVLMPRLTRPAVTIGAAAVLGIGLVGGLAAGQAFASPSHQQCSPTVSSAPFGKTVEPYTGKLTQIYRYTLTNCRGMQIHLLSYGGDHPVDRGAGPQRAGGRRRPGLQDPQGLRHRGQPAGDRERRPVLRRDHRPLRQPHRQGHVPAAAAERARDLHAADQQRRQRPARRPRRLRRPRLVAGRQADLDGNGPACTLQLVSPNGDSSGAVGSPGCPTAAPASRRSSPWT